VKLVEDFSALDLQYIENPITTALGEFLSFTLSLACHLDYFAWPISPKGAVTGSGGHFRGAAAELIATPRQLVLEEPTRIG
jgi:hypothetical protein